MPPPTAPSYAETLTCPAYTYEPTTPALSVSSSRSLPSLLDPPPDYPAPPALDPVSRLPSAFRIGLHDVKPVVAVPQLLNHCKLLACFWELRKAVVETPWVPSDLPPGRSTADVDPTVKWSVFCTLAEKRFEFWVTETLARRGAAAPLKSDELPGIEVLMVWHSYMLNPRCESRRREQGRIWRS